ncbi:FAD-dependent oxidoreductase [Natronospora cellulosivora (SeqCode)]
MQKLSMNREIPIKKKFDLIVCGGGPAGIGAAIAAARQGIKVALIENNGFLGGNITASYVETCNHFLWKHPYQVTGIYKEIEDEYRKEYDRSDDIRTDMDPHRFSSEYLKVFLDKKMEEEGVWLRLHTRVSDVIVEDNIIKGVISSSKSGFEALMSDVVIDCTGDGDIAARAGVPYEQGRDNDGLVQPGTVNFRLAGVNSKKVKEILDEKGIQYYYDIYHEKVAEGVIDMGYKRMGFPMGRLTEGGQITYINFCNAYKLDPTNADDITKGEVLARERVMKLFNFMRDYLPGFEKAELASIAPSIGYRDSRRIKGDYRLTEEDIDSQKMFEDNIALYPRVYDILSPTGTWDDHVYVVDLDKEYGIPYRSLLPVNIEQLLLAGRCISTDHMAESSVRAISACMATGQAAGTAAGVAIKSNTTARDVDVQDLQEELRKQGVSL